MPVAPKGRRALCSVPRNSGNNTTLLESMTAEGMGPCLAVVGSTTKAVFEAYVERGLCPILSKGQVVVMDNLTAHKGERVKALIEQRGCELLYLPAYSPDLNPKQPGMHVLRNSWRLERNEALGVSEDHLPWLYSPKL